MRRAAPGPARVRQGVLRVLDSISAPAYVRDNSMDVLAANRLGRALFADVYAEGATGFNLAGYLFLDARSAISTPSGMSSPATPSPPCASKQAATPTTAA